MMRHRSAEWNATKTYDNPGVIAQLHAIASAPATRIEDEHWSAGGRPVGEIRVYFDGERGGQDVSFQGKSVNDAAQDRKLRIAYSMHPISGTSQPLQVAEHGRLRSSFARAGLCMLTCVPAGGDPVKYYVSTRTARILRREFNDRRTIMATIVTSMGKSSPSSRS